MENRSMDKYLIQVSEETVPSGELLKNPNHTLQIETNSENDYVQMNFSSRLAMFNYAKALLAESIFGRTGRIEHFYLSDNIDHYITDGVRLTKKSPRVFISYPEKDKLNEDHIK